MEQAKKYNTKMSIMGQIKTLGKGDKISFPIEKTLYIRAICTNCGYELGIKYSTHVNRKDKTIEVTRTV